LSQSLALLSTNGSMQYPNTVRTSVSARQQNYLPHQPVKWDTTGQNFRDLRWFLQSASLYSRDYHLQILVHRPFIPSSRKPSPLSFPSLAICTNAARSCARGGSAAPPSHNIPLRISRHASLFSITVQNVADVFFAASRVYCWHRSLVEYMGCKARRWRD
jgi:hypothetical protein